MAPFSRYLVVSFAALVAVSFNAAAEEPGKDTRGRNRLAGEVNVGTTDVTVYDSDKTPSVVKDAKTSQSSVQLHYQNVQHRASLADPQETGMNISMGFGGGKSQVGAEYYWDIKDDKRPESTKRSLYMDFNHNNLTTEGQSVIGFSTFRHLGAGIGPKGTLPGRSATFAEGHSRSFGWSAEAGRSYAGGESQLALHVSWEEIHRWCTQVGQRNKQFCIDLQGKAGVGTDLHAEGKVGATIAWDLTGHGDINDRSYLFVSPYISATGTKYLNSDVKVNAQQTGIVAGITY